MDILIYTICLYFLCVSAIIDIETHKVPNEISYLAIIMGFSINYISSPETLWINLAMAIPFIVLGFINAMGMGDVKLFIAIIAFSGIEVLLYTLILSELMFIICKAMTRKSEFIVSVNSIKNLSLNRNLNEGFPFAPFIAVGFYVAYFALRIL